MRCCAYECSNRNWMGDCVFSACCRIDLYEKYHRRYQSNSTAYNYHPLQSIGTTIYENIKENNK